MIDHLSVVFPYWEAPMMLREQVSQLARWPEEYRDRLTVLICDDCSERHPIDLGFLKSQPLMIEAYRITEKAPWNYRGAKNIVMHHAPDGWALVTDIDHVLMASDAGAVFSGHFNPEKVYHLRRQSVSGGSLKSVNALHLMTREMFWRSGGYDESYVGTHMGKAGERPARLRKASQGIELSPVVLTRYSRSIAGDEPDNLVRGREPYADLLAEIEAKWTGIKTMTFPYERVL